MKISKVAAAAVVFAGITGYSNLLLAAEGGVFKAKRADITTQEQYAKLLESLKSLEIWAALGSAREGGVAKSLQAYQKFIEIYSPLIVENGEAIVPVYADDNLGLKDLDGFRKFASRVEYDKSFVPDDNTCSAAITFVFPRQIADVLSDARPTYVYGGVQSEQQIESARSVRIEKGLDDLGYVKAMCRNYKDRNYDNGYINLIMNLQADLKTILPAVDQTYLASVPKPPAPSVSSAQAASASRPFDIPKAYKFSACSGLLTAMNQFFMAHGKPADEILTNAGLEMGYAAIVYSNVDYMLETSQSWNKIYTSEINNNPANVQAWGQPKMQDCIAAHRENRADIKAFGEQARAEFFAKADSLINDLKHDR